MARPKRRDSPLELTSTEVSLGGGLSKGNMEFLQRRGFFPKPVSETSGKHSSAIYDIEGLKHAVCIGAPTSAGIPLLVSAQIACRLAEYFTGNQYGFKSNLEKYLSKPYNKGNDRFPWKGSTEDHTTEEINDFWLHHMLITRTNLYKRNHAIIGDLVMVIADRKYVFFDFFGKKDDDLRSSKKKAFYSPELLIEGWASGEEIQVRWLYGDVIQFNGLSDDLDAYRDSWGAYAKMEQEASELRHNAIALLHLNLSLACRNALDAIRDHRIATRHPFYV